MFAQDTKSSETEKQTCKEVVDTFLSKTTTHGLPSIRRGGTFKKVIWSTVFVMSISGFMAHLYAISSWYGSYVVDTRTHFKHDRQLDFPSVTVCNMNPMKLSHMLQSPRLSSLMKKWGVTANPRRKRDVRNQHNVNQQNVNQQNVNQQNVQKQDLMRQTMNKQLANQQDVGQNIKQQSMNQVHSNYKESLQTANQQIINQPNEELKKRYKREEEERDDEVCASWSDDGSKCYWLAAPLALFYSTGQMMCEMDGGRMVTIQKETEFKNIYKVFDRNVPTADPRIFLNLHYVLAHRTFFWDKKVAMTWTGWAEGYPTAEKTSDCVTSKAKNDYSWQNVKCAISSAYCVCEKVFGDGGGASASTVDPQTTTQTSMESTTFPNLSLSTIEEFVTTQEPYEPATILFKDITTEDWMESKEASTNANSNGNPYIEQTTEQAYGDWERITTPEPPLPIPGPGSAFPDRPPLRESFMFENEVIEFLADAPMDVKKSLGYTFDEFVLDCRFAGRDCMKDGFGMFFDAVHGNCFVFNSGWKNTSDKSYKTYMAGRSHGLELVINIEQEEYIPNLIDGAGAVVVVHTPQRMPFPEDEGVLAMPGQVTSVAITQVKVDRLDGSYGNCTRILHDKRRNVFEEEHNVHYSINACLKTCYQYHVISQCGCADPQYPFKGEAFKDLKENVASCSSQDVKEEDCVYNITLQYNADKLECNCSNTCTDTLYKHSVSMTEWPAEVFEDDVLEKYASKISYDNADGKDAFRDNLLKVEVYFNQLNFKHIQEKPKYTLYQYLSDVGAILGLWLGMSVISIFEFAQFVMDICCPERQQPQQPVPVRKRSFLESANDLRRGSYDWSKSQINGMLKSLRRVSTKKDHVKPKPKVTISSTIASSSNVCIDSLPDVESPTLSSHLLCNKAHEPKLLHRPKPPTKGTF